MAEVKRPPQQQTLPERKHGILYNLLWGWPWAWWAWCCPRCC